MQQYNGAGKPSSPNIPWLCDNIYQGFSTESVTETLNLVEYEKDAAGTTVIVELTSRRIFDRKGGKLGSYWGNEENLQYTVDQPAHISGVVLTDGSAAVAVYDSAIDLEKIFESATKARYVLKLTDRAGKAYYGFIGGVAASSGVYTFTIYNGVAMGTQNWVKTWGSGIAAPYAKVEIYEYSTSIEWGSADTFTEELPYSEFATDYDQLKSLTDGQYRIDYRRGRLLGRKLNADNTEDITYIGLKAGGATSEVNLAEVGGTAFDLGQEASAGSLPVVIASDQVGLIGGGGAGGGNNTYSTEQGDFTATVTDATTNIVLNVDSIGGVAIDENHFANGLLKVWDASTEEMIKITLDDFTWTAATKTLAVANCTGAFTFATGDIVSLTLTGPDKMRDSSTDAQRTSPIRDLSDQYTYDTFTLANVPNATPDETIIIDLSGYKGWSVHLEKTGGTDTFDTDYFVSNEDALSTADWLEIAPTFASGSATADHIAHPASELLKTKALKLKITTAGGANDMGAQIFVTRWY